MKANETFIPARFFGFYKMSINWSPIFCCVFAYTQSRTKVFRVVSIFRMNKSDLLGASAPLKNLFIFSIVQLRFKFVIVFFFKRYTKVHLNHNFSENKIFKNCTSLYTFWFWSESVLGSMIVNCLLDLTINPASACRNLKQVLYEYVLYVYTRIYDALCIPYTILPSRPTTLLPVT